MKPHTHYCCKCGEPWTCGGVGKGKICEVDKAIKANKGGPYCTMCFHLEMACRYAANKGFEIFTSTHRLRAALLTVLDQVDYKKGACAATEMVGAVLSKQVLEMCHEVLEDTATCPVAEQTTPESSGTPSPSARRPAGKCAPAAA